MWLRGVKQNQDTSDHREAKRQKLEAERANRLKRAKERAERQAQLQKQFKAAEQAQEEANQTYREFLDIAIDIFGDVTNLEEENKEQNPPQGQPQQPIMTNYDVEDKDDGEDYYLRISMVKLAWDNDVNYWFNSIEASLRHAQVFKQWTKREIIQGLLPEHVRDEVKYLLRLNKDEAGELPYKDIKDAILEMYAPKPQDCIDKALSRVLTTRPSLLAKQLINDLCKCKPVLTSKCCADIVFGLFRRQLPTAVRNRLAGEVFTKDTYKAVLILADQVYQSNQPDAHGAASVSSVQSSSSGPVQASGEISAIRGGNRGGRGRGARGNRGGRGRGGTQSGQSTQNSNQNSGAKKNKGTKHPDNPPDSVCQSHFSFGKSALFCRRPLSCPWKDFIAPE